MQHPFVYDPFDGDAKPIHGCHGWILWALDHNTHNENLIFMIIIPEKLAETMAKTEEEKDNVNDTLDVRNIWNIYGSNSPSCNGRVQSESLNAQPKDRCC